MDFLYLEELLIPLLYFGLENYLYLHILSDINIKSYIFYPLVCPEGQTGRWNVMPRIWKGKSINAVSSFARSGPQVKGQPQGPFDWKSCPALFGAIQLDIKIRC
jgi:hypothetical protein